MIAAAVEAVRDGLIVGIPTDTVYGIGVDPLNRAAVERLFELKGRPADRPVGLLVATAGQARQVGDLGETGEELAAKHWPGALTLVVEPRVILSDWVGDQQRRTVGIRVPDSSVAVELLQIVGPMAVTSANRSGEPETMSDTEAKDALGDEVAVYLKGTCPGGLASTVVDLTGSEPRVIRRGPVSI